MKQYTAKVHNINAFQITHVDFIKPKQLANAQEQPEYIQLTGEDDVINVTREFVSEYQPNIGDWYLTNYYKDRVVSDDYFQHTYNK